MLHSHLAEDHRRALVIVFAKAPIPNFVKTRLTPRLDPFAACRLHEAFVQDTLHQLDEFEVELHTDQPTSAWKQCKFVRKLQRDGDLGHRMLHAMESALSQGRKPVLILGSDSPTLPPAHLRKILQSRADVCLGPADDGGYYAISCRRTAPNMFEGVKWSTGETREQTVHAAQKAGLTVEIGPPWYDIDSGEDLLRLATDPGLGSATQHALALAGIPVPNPPSAS